MARRHSAAIRLEVTPLNFSGEVRFESIVKENPPSNIIRGRELTTTKSGMSGNTFFMQTRTKTSGIEVAMAFSNVLESSDSTVAVTTFGDGLATSTVSAEVLEGETAIFTKSGCFYSTLDADGSIIMDKVLHGLSQDVTDGFDTLLREQRDFWKAYWENADIEIGGSTKEQAAIRFCLFHLRQSNPENNYKSIPATGETSDGYSGHVFWDTEMYMVPQFTYTEPELVRPLLIYRYNLLARARERADQMDGVGALYSWESTNGEECGVIYEASTAEYHINSDIVYAIWRYVQSTDDTEFLCDYGAEIVFETARFLADRGKFIPLRGNKFCINVVCGPDEYNCGVDNNCYTNMLTQFHFEYAVKIYEVIEAEYPGNLSKLAEKIGLSDEEPATWKRAAENMYIPWNEEHGIHAQDDSYIYRDPVDMSQVAMYTDIRGDYHPLNLWRLQLTKQADVVLLMFILGDRFSTDVKRANYEFYEPRTNHGSSLSPSIHSIMAAEIGKRTAAYDYFRESLYMDLYDVKNNTNAGVHAASLGGTWMSIVNGIAGMRDYEDKLIFNPYLPPEWEYCRFTVNYRGRIIGITIDQQNAEYRLISGRDIVFVSGETTVELSPNRSILSVPNSTPV